MKNADPEALRLLIFINLFITMVGSIVEGVGLTQRSVYISSVIFLTIKRL